MILYVCHRSLTTIQFRYYRQTQDLLPYLEELNQVLYTVVIQDQSGDQDDIGVLPLYPSSAARSAWLGFIFRESCRRTHLAVCHALSICSFLQGEVPACYSNVSIRVTLSAALWEAKSPLEFAIAWNEGNHYLLKDPDLTELLRSAEAKDVDVFGRMMMVGIMGKDDLSGWLHSKGGKL